MRAQGFNPGSPQIAGVGHVSACTNLPRLALSHPGSEARNALHHRDNCPFPWAGDSRKPAVAPCTTVGASKGQAHLHRINRQQKQRYLPYCPRKSPLSHRAGRGTQRGRTTTFRACQGPNRACGRTAKQHQGHASICKPAGARQAGVPPVKFGPMLLHCLGQLPSMSAPQPSLPAGV